jgi:hypothetical protein|tara:strand:+ start:57 stop:275 length:219 start_codon:yes stop_codon:yes gene_type:complete
MAQYKVIQALKTQAEADKAKALMALELLTEMAVGIGDHTSDDFLKDATKSLKLLASAEERLETIEKYYGKNS